LTTYSLQTTFFIAFGRVFDARADSFSVDDLVEATIEHPGFFSKTEVRRKKRESSMIFGEQPDPEWLVTYMDNKVDLTRKNLETLRAALRPHAEKFKQIYEPIRHKFFAHRGRASDEAIGALFGRTLIGDVSEILRFLHTLTWAIQDMVSNGNTPDLTNFSDYHSYVTDVTSQVESVVKSQP
jgi:hypothetical protein